MKARTVRTIFLLLTLTVSQTLGVLASTTDEPNVKIERVEALSYRTFTMTCDRGEFTELAIIGDGDTDLDLFIYDPEGRLIAADDDDQSKCVVRWTAQSKGRYTIKVVNLGRVWSRFALVYR